MLLDQSKSLGYLIFEIDFEFHFTLKTLDQFDDEGCDNCDDIIHLKGNRERVFDCTSANFDGLIALMDPSDSWVAKWQHLDSNVRGMYAISVSGDIPEQIKRLLRDKNLQYKNRDISQKI